MGVGEGRRSGQVRQGGKVDPSNKKGADNVRLASGDFLDLVDEVVTLPILPAVCGGRGWGGRGGRVG